MAGSHPSPPTLYDVLRVQQSASNEEIRKAYKRRALRTHPDKLAPSASPLERQAAEVEFRLVAQALHVLSDPQRRKRYDQHLVASHKPSKPVPQRTQVVPTPTSRDDSDTSSHKAKLKKEREEWAKKVAREQEERLHAFRTHGGPSRPQHPSNIAPEPPIDNPLVKKLYEELRAQNPEWVRREKEIKQRQAERIRFAPRHSTT